MKGTISSMLVTLYGLFFCSTLLGTVAPIAVGENIWQLSRRIGDTADIIETKVCDIEDKVCDLQESATEILEKTCLIPRCNFTIAQSDIPFTISTPGTYCVEENLDASAAGAFGIDISTGSVVLDFEGHTIDGGGAVTDAVLANGISNFTIRNGTIKDANVNALEIISSSNFRVEHMDFAGSATGLLLSGSSRFLVKDCNFSGQNSEGVCLSSCLEALFKDIKISSSFDGFVNRAGLCLDIVLDSCQCFDSIFDGFLFQNTVNLQIKNCVSLNNGSDGFFISAATRAVVDHCFASGNGATNFTCSVSTQVSFLNCVAVDAFGSHGFSVLTSTDITIMNCLAKGNAGSGIFLSISPSNVFRNLSYSNGGADYTGVPAALIATGTAAIAAAANQWTNITP